MGKDDRKQILRMSTKILIRILFGTVLVVNIMVFYDNVKKKEMSDLRYTIETKEERRKIKAKEILKEKGKEDRYRIEIFDDETEIPASIYEEYIGDESNMLTIQESEMIVYVGNTSIFHTSSSFSGEINVICESRISYPWECDVKPYTEKDAKALAMSYLKGDVSINGVYTDPENLREF